MQNTTLDPVEITQLHFLTRRQAEIYCVMDPRAFREFCLRRAVPFQCDKPEAPRSKRRYSRAVLEKAMMDDMKNGEPAGYLQAEVRIAQIVGESR